jgi:hypothetical protein
METAFNVPLGFRLALSRVIGSRALSLGERVSGDGAFTSRRRTGEGTVPTPTKLFLPR